MSINKYKVTIEIYVNASDRKEAEKEAGYQIYHTSYDKETKIEIELLEEGEEGKSNGRK